MRPIIHTTFADRYLVRKVRAIAGASPAWRDPALATYRILGLLQKRCGVPSWAGYYVRRRGGLSLKRFREDPLWEFPPGARPERRLPCPTERLLPLPSPAPGLREFRLPIRRDGSLAGMLRACLPEGSAERIPAPPVLLEIAEALASLCDSPGERARRRRAPRNKMAL